MKLNLGCGNNYREGYVNIDKFAAKVDIKHDLNIFPYPIETNSIDFIWMSNVLEHLKEPEIVLKEIIRMLKFGGRAIIKVPHYQHPTSYMNIGHRFHFHENALDANLAENKSDSSLIGGFKLIEKSVKRNKHRFWKKQSIKWVIEKTK